MKTPLNDDEFETMERAYLQLKSCLWFLTEQELESLKKAIDFELKERDKYANI